MTPSFCASILKPRRARRLCLCRSRRLSVPLSVALISPSLPHWCNKRQTCLRTTGGAWDSHPTLSGSKQQRVALHTRCNTRTINHICFSLGAYTHTHTPQRLQPNRGFCLIFPLLWHHHEKVGVVSFDASAMNGGSSAQHGAFFKNASAAQSESFCSFCLQYTSERRVQSVRR